MTKIYNYLIAQSKSLSTYATNPLWQVVDGPYKLTAYNATTGGFTMSPNTSYGGPHVTPMSTFQGVPFTSDAAQFNAIKAGSIDVAAVPARTTCRSCRASLARTTATTTSASRTSA
jgi:peptide/nickel transport system substrate-binding protein